MWVCVYVLHEHHTRLHRSGIEPLTFETAPFASSGHAHAWGTDPSFPIGYFSHWFWPWVWLVDAVSWFPPIWIPCEERWGYGRYMLLTHFFREHRRKTYYYAPTPSSVLTANNLFKMSSKKYYLDYICISLYCSLVISLTTIIHKFLK